jgi:two-component system, cell cycle sensor histidine kinase and response regulator CckA
MEHESTHGSDAGRPPKALQAPGYPDSWYRRLFESAKDAIFVVDPATMRFLDSNEGGCASLGCTREQMLGLTVPEVTVGLEPAMFAKTVAKIRDTGHAMLEVVHRRRDGSTFPAEVSLSLVRLDREYLVGIVRDITERKIAETRLREQNEILSNSREGVMIVNLANEVTLWNHGAEVMFGRPAAEVLGRAPEEVLGINDPGIVSTLRVAVSRDGFWRGELRLKARDGRELIVEARITLVCDAAGRPRARLNFLADITDRKLLEEKFLHAQRLESIGMLAAGIAHDLNNVLAPIMFAAPLLRQSLSNPDDLKVLETLEQSAGRGAGLVRQILGFVHRATGEFRSTQVRDIAQDIVSFVAQTFPKSIQIRSEIPFDLWPVMGDATQIHQVLLNLSVNARDAMPRGGTLRIAAANRRLDAAAAGAIPEARSGAWCVLEVSDTGNGISPEVKEHLWKPFFTTKGAGKGTGLGLTTIRGIVSNHNGFVELQTEVGRGTTFLVYLPAIESPARAPGNAPRPSVSGGHGELVLVVDDDAAVRNVVATALERQGYRVARCADGKEAITLFKSQPDNVSLVVTDVDMPRVGGAALIRALVKLRPGVRLLGICGLSRSEADSPDVIEVQNSAHGFLHKPFTIEELLIAVRKVLLDREGS